MDKNGGGKVTGIRQIVRLKEMLRKWQTVALGPKISRSSSSSRRSSARLLPKPEYVRGGISPGVSRRIMSSSVHCGDSDDDGCQSPEPPHGVPKGNLAVYVGPELRRFVIPTSYLSDPLFKVLLEKAEEEFGFDQCGGLTIPCETETFKYLRQCIERKVQSGRNEARNSITVKE